IPTIPVAFTSFAIGDDLYNAYNGLSPYTAPSPPKMSLSIPAIFTFNAPDYNVIAESPGGDPNHVVVVDAHLDAIYGEGMLDNAAIGYFNSIGLNTEPFSPVGTDAEQFNLAGIPASGVLTGQDCCKTQDDVNLFGGTTGLFEGFGTSDGCVDNPFLWCDNLSNNDSRVLTLMSRRFAVMVVDMAFDTKVMSSSNN